jgi:hypothetical protein
MPSSPKNCFRKAAHLSKAKVEHLLDVNRMQKEP